MMIIHSLIVSSVFGNSGFVVPITLDTSGRPRISLTIRDLPDRESDTAVLALTAWSSFYGIGDLPFYDITLRSSGDHQDVTLSVPVSPERSTHRGNQLLGIGYGSRSDDYFASISFIQNYTGPMFLGFNASREYFHETCLNDTFVELALWNNTELRGFVSVDDDHDDYARFISIKLYEASFESEIFVLDHRSERRVTNILVAAGSTTYYDGSRGRRFRNCTHLPTSLSLRLSLIRSDRRRAEILIDPNEYIHLVPSINECWFYVNHDRAVFNPLMFPGMNVRYSSALAESETLSICQSSL